GVSASCCKISTGLGGIALQGGCRRRCGCRKQREGGRRPTEPVTLRAHVVSPFLSLPRSVRGNRNVGPASAIAVSAQPSLRTVGRHNFPQAAASRFPTKTDSRAPSA